MSDKSLELLVLQKELIFYSNKRLPELNVLPILSQNGVFAAKSLDKKPLCGIKYDVLADHIYGDISSAGR